jgi:hypothetical protein
MDPNQPVNQPNNPYGQPTVTPMPTAGGVVMPDAAPQPVVVQTPQMPPVSAMPAFMQPPDPVMQQAAPEAAPTGPAAAAIAGENPDKSYLVTLLLSYFLGSVGADRFYLGRTGSAIAKLLTFGGFGIWVIVDMFLIAFGKLTAKDDPRLLEGFTKEFHWVKILAIVLIIFDVIVLGGFIILVIVSAAVGLNDAASGI